jgi:hypothetical protein
MKTTLTPTYHAVAGDEGHAVVLTLTVTSDNTCGTATATATYTINVDALPTASTTGSGTQTVCANSSYTLTGGEASATHGTILWTTSNGLGTISMKQHSRLLSCSSR